MEQARHEEAALRRVVREAKPMLPSSDDQPTFSCIHTNRCFLRLTISHRSAVLTLIDVFSD